MTQHTEGGNSEAESKRSRAVGCGSTDKSVQLHVFIHVLCPFVIHI